MSEQLPFRKGDIVRLIKDSDGYYNDLPEVGTEITIENAHAPSEWYPTGLYGPVSCYNIEPEYFELVFRPATREETERLRELAEAALDYYDYKRFPDFDVLEAANNLTGAVRVYRQWKETNVDA